MDRQFMLEYFDKMYEEPTTAAVKGDPEYEMLQKKMDQMVDEFEEMLGGEQSKESRILEEILTLADELSFRAVTGAYLMGARDRERMLR
ncbi:MAG: hypothetical protein LUI13_06675 [Lachnospiraceae bacterium]|nr:hypothetical protein [Lachnospiraceae bacterium]